MSFIVKAIVHNCENLEKSDTLTGSTDPYVVVSVGNQKRTTKVVTKNVNPNFEESYQFRVKDPMAEFMSFKVYDKDKLKKDDQIGICKIPLSLLPRGKICKVKMKLEQTSQGKIFISIQAVNFGYVSEQKPTTPPVPSLRVTVHKAIINKKLKIDPFVILSIGDKGKKKKDETREEDKRWKKQTTVQKGTLRPEWNESFLFPLGDKDDNLELVVMDKDYLTKDDHVGKCFIPINCLPFEKTVVRQLTVFKKKVPMGDILVTIRTIDAGNKQF